MKEEKLKPCPFCGGPATCHGEDQIFARWMLCVVRCDWCLVATKYFKKRVEAIAQWNTRTAPQE